MEEVWTDMTEITDKLQLSNFGRIRRKDSTMIVLTKCSGDKYPRFTVNRKTYRIHRLVAKYFLPNPRNHKIVRHLDSSPTGKLNNHVSNLRWGSSRAVQLNNKHVIEFKNGRYYPIVWLYKKRLVLKPCRTETLAVENLRQFKDLFSQYT